jgi:hypothetical protein
MCFMISYVTNFFFNEGFVTPPSLLIASQETSALESQAKKLESVSLRICSRGSRWATFLNHPAHLEATGQVTVTMLRLYQYYCILMIHIHCIRGRLQGWYRRELLEQLAYLLACAGDHCTSLRNFPQASCTLGLLSNAD